MTMSLLEEKKCSVCRADAPRLTESELNELLPQIPDWTVDSASVDKLKREYPFKGFMPAMDFANKVGGIAEEEGHHPAITVEWGKVTVQWWTHKINGLHENDVIMAAKTDAIY